MMNLARTGPPPHQQYFLTITSEYQRRSQLPPEPRQQAASVQFPPSQKHVTVPPIIHHKTASRPTFGGCPPPPLTAFDIHRQSNIANACDCRSPPCDLEKAPLKRKIATYFPLRNLFSGVVDLNMMEALYSVDHGMLIPCGYYLPTFFWTIFSLLRVLVSFF